MSTATKLLTAEDFWLLPDSVLRRSLVRGEVVETMPPGGRHGAVAVLFAARLQRWSVEHNAGTVGVEAGFILLRDPDGVRCPDIYFVRADRVPPDGVPEGFWNLAPDLAVEVISPSESAEDVADKVHDYLTAGVPLVWVAYPRRRAVVAHTPDGLARTFRTDDLLAAPDLRPGFSCIVGELFA